MAYVYEHWRPDLHLPFWVGKGSGNRARLLTRNRHYDAIVRKLQKMGLKVEVSIVADDLSDEDAFDLERYRMAFWRLWDVPLANKSVGGRGGMTGVRRTRASRAKQSATTTGRKLSPEHAAKVRARMQSPEMRALSSRIHTGRKRPSITGRRISAGLKRSWANPTTRQRHIAAIRRAVCGRAVSDETRTKMRAAKTPEARAKISAAAKKQWQNPAFRELVSSTMKATNAKRRRPCTEQY